MGLVLTPGSDGPAELERKLIQRASARAVRGKARRAIERRGRGDDGRDVGRTYNVGRRLDSAAES